MLATKCKVCFSDARNYLKNDYCKFRELITRICLF